MERDVVRFPFHGAVWPKKRTAIALLRGRSETDLMPDIDVIGMPAGAQEKEIQHWKSVVETRPQDGSAWHRLAELTSNAGNFQEALGFHEHAVSLEPENQQFLLGMGNTCAFLGDNLRAIECYGKILQLSPQSAVTWNNLGNLFARLNDLLNALSCYQNAIRFEPRESNFHYNLGRTLDQCGRHIEAIEHLNRARELRPDQEDIWTNLGNAFQHTGNYGFALQCYDEALKLAKKPDELHVNRAVVLLNQGNFKEGWAEYEHRWNTDAFAVYKKRSFGCPQWRGGSLAGKKILLHAEQGFGDAIQFARFIPEVSARGAEVFVEVGAPLAALMTSLVDPPHLVTRGEAAPKTDFHCSLISLPFALGTELGDLSGKPYLSVPPSALKLAKQAIDQATVGRPKLRVGINWRGNPTHRWDHLRSLKPPQLAPLAKVPGVQWFLLQRDVSKEELISFPDGTPWTPFETEQLDGFQAIGALVQTLDLVVSIDTVTAHLAGALGKPLWLLIPTFYEWRWHTHLQHSPWYSSARLFRQPEPGTWQPALDSMAEALTELVRG